MLNQLELLLPKELENIINKAQEILNIKEHSKGIVDLVIHNERTNVCCPRCESTNIKKNGKYKNRQLYKCKDCNKKFNELTIHHFIIPDLIMDK